MTLRKSVPRNNVFQIKFIWKSENDNESGETFQNRNDSYHVHDVKMNLLEFKTNVSDLELFLFLMMNKFKHTKLVCSPIFGI